MIAQEVHTSKQDMAEHLLALRQLVETAARDGTPAHEVERELFQHLLSMGHSVLDEFFRRQGSGDLGEQISLREGEVLYRQPALHDRRYATIFGEFTLTPTYSSSAENREASRDVRCFMG